MGRHPATTETTSAPIPKVSLLQMLFRIVFSGGEERINMRSTLSRQYDELGPVVLQDVGIMKMVNLFGPDANRLVLLDQDRIFSARRPWMQIMGRIFPNGLLLQDGGLHKHHRKIMHMPFKRPALRIYGERMGEMIDERLSAWEVRTEMKVPLPAFPAYKALTLDMAAAIFIGVDLGPSTQQMNQAFEDMVAASMSRVRLPVAGLEFYRGLKGREFMLGFLGDLLPKKRAGDGLDMLTRLCHAETQEAERFSPARAEHERHSHSWVPFGGGEHMCLGLRFAELQVKAVIHQLVQRFRIRIPDGYQMPVQQAPISKPRDGLPIQLEAIG